MRFPPILTFQCSTPGRNIRRQPKSCFGENQLLPSSISFSLLTTGHPNELNDIRVRAFICLSTNFTLPMASSLGFGSYTYDKRAINTRFPCACGGKPLRQRHIYKIVGSFFNRHAVTVRKLLRLLVGIRFQVYFTALSGLLFTFPSRY